MTSAKLYPIAEDINDFIKDAVGVIEATNCEKSFIWDRWHNELCYEWEEILTGRLPAVGEIDDRPIHISLWAANIKGKRVIFWHATSQVVDYAIIEQWWDENWPVGAVNEYGRRVKSDATNAHIVMHALSLINQRNAA